MSSLITGWVLALALGIRHASEPDHLVAVSTLVADARSPRRAAVLGAIWGIGHSLSLFAVGGALLLLRGEMPDRIAAMFELGVACMLLLLGARSIAHAVRLRAAEIAHVRGEHGSRPALGLHQHGSGAPHRHIASTNPFLTSEAGETSASRTPLFIGLVHGLAGSGALTALALANMPSLPSALAYIAFFGLGSVLGMAAISGVVGIPLSRATTRLRVQAAALATTGVLSLVVGVAWGWPLLARVSGG